MPNPLPHNAQPPSKPPTVGESRVDQSVYRPMPRHNTLDPHVGMTIGRYKLLSKLGEGGMGAVYLAEQIEPVRRQVALKLIRGHLDSHSVIKRFEAERQALAVMDHPSIARIYDGGTTPTGQPYFVMELVQGRPITEYCDEHRLTPRQRLELFIPICQALQHAHQKGIIHRDLKPGNVLVVEVDGRPVPKVIDFGVAKATEQPLTDQTLLETGLIFGTPLYMSPEQAEPDKMDVDTRTDIYALGVMLYELLTGSPPIDVREFRAGALLEVLRMVRELEPPKPSTKLSTADALPSIAANRGVEPRQLQTMLRGDLDWIVMKAIDKDRTRRYGTANGFAADVQRYLAGEAVLAHPPTRWYLLSKFVKRHRVQVIASSLILASLVAGLGVSLWLMNRALEAEAQAQHNEVKAQDAALQERKARVEEARQRKEAEAVALLLENLYRGINPTAQRKDLEDLRSILAVRLDQSAQQLDKEFSGEPLTRARLQHAIAETQLGLGDGNKALALLESSLAARRKLLGEETRDTETLLCLSDLAAALQATGRLPEAITLKEKTLKLMQEQLGPDDPRTIETQSELANGYHLAGRREEALPLYTEVIQRAETSDGVRPLHVAKYKNNLAVLMRDMARFDRSELLYQDALKIQVAQLGTSHPDTLATKDNLSGLYLDQGKYPASVTLCREVLSARMERLGPDHAATHRSRNNLANALLHAGQPKDAIPFLEESYEREKRNLGPEHPSTLTCMANLATAYRDVGRLQDAMPLFEQTYQIRKVKLGPNHPSTMTSMNNLAIGYSETGKQAESVKLQEELVKLRRDKLGSDHPETLIAMDNLAGGYHRQGRKVEAVSLMEESLRRITARLGQDHPDTLITKSNLAFIYQEIGRTKEAIPLLEGSLKIAQTKMGKDHPTTITIMNNLASLYREDKRWNDAATLFEVTLKLARAKFGPSHPKTIMTLINQAGTYQDSGQAGKAIPIYEEVLRLRRSKPGPEAAETQESMSHLAQAYLEANEKLTEAEKLFREIHDWRVKKQPQAWNTFNTQSMIGAALIRLKKLAEAEPYLVQGYQGMKQREATLPPAGRKRLRESIDRLIQLYTETHKPEEVKKWQAEKEKLPKAEEKKY